MSTDDRKAPPTSSPTDKQDEKISDLPKPNKTEKDDQVKGGAPMTGIIRR